MAEQTEAKQKKAKPEGGASKKSSGGRSKKGEAAAGLRVASPGETRVSPSIGKPRMKILYETTAVPSLQKQFGYTNSMQVPRLVKVVVNCGVKEAVGNPKVLDSAMEDLRKITGQKPVLTRAKKAIAAFKVRKGNPVGTFVTLRRARMFEFLDRLVNVSLPRVRDFKGVNPKGFDGRGNYSLGLKEQIIFPEIDYDAVDSVRGMTITIVTTAQSNEQARALLSELGMPFRT